MEKGTLIILNGGSSVGKTSLGKALQDAMRALQDGLRPTAFDQMRRKFLR